MAAGQTTSLLMSKRGREEEKAGATVLGEGAREEASEDDLEHPGMPEGREDQLVMPGEARRGPSGALARP